MKSFTLSTVFIFAFAMLAVSCQKTNKHHTVTVPLTAQFQDSATLLVAGTPTSPEKVLINGWGNGSPIGAATFTDSVLVDISVSPEKISGVEVITAAGGDKIFAAISGYSPDPDKDGNYQVFNTNTIVGGTGKFAGATGQYSVKVKGNFNSIIENDLYSCTITY